MLQIDRKCCKLIENAPNEPNYVLERFQTNMKV